MEVNYSRQFHPPGPSSLANLVHHTESVPSPPVSSCRPPSPTSSHPTPRHSTPSNPSHFPYAQLTTRPSNSHPPADPRRYPPRPDSDDGSQQERNHQRPSGKISHRVPPGVPRTSRASADISPKAPHEVKSAPPADISSLTGKPEDHASSVVPPTALDGLFPSYSKHDRNEDELDDENPISRRARPRRDVDVSPRKALQRASLKDGRVELLEENRMLRVQLDASRYRARRMESDYKRLKRILSKRDAILARYRSQLLGLFEDDEDPTQLNHQPLSAGGFKAPLNSESKLLRGLKKGKDQSRSFLEGESCSNSQEYGIEQDDWFSFSEGSGGSPTYETEQVDVGMASMDRVNGTLSEGTLRKRTRAPAWSVEEELKFMETYEKHGCQWKMFQSALPGRSRRQIQSHGSYLIRQGKLRKKNSRPWQRRKQSGEISHREGNGLDQSEDIDEENNE